MLTEDSGLVLLLRPHGASTLAVMNAVLLVVTVVTAHGTDHPVGARIPRPADHATPLLAVMTGVSVTMTAVTATRTTDVTVTMTAATVVDHALQRAATGK